MGLGARRCFVCSSGQILHMSYCADGGEVVTNETVEKVAATISMELDRQPTDALIKSGVAAALDVPEPNVHGLQWILGRRLQPAFLGSEGRRLDTKYNYYVRVEGVKTPAHRVLLMALTIFADFRYFNNNSNDSGGGDAIGGALALE